MLEDYHVHCDFSDDSEEPMENQIEKAVQLDLDEICFTDHVDYGIKRDQDDPLGIETKQAFYMGETITCVLSNVNYPEYFRKLKQMKQLYQDRITIRKGLEFGVQTITVDQYERLFDRYEDELDFVLLSMHQVGNLEFWAQDFQRGKTRKEAYDAYYREIYEVQKMFRHYSVLAHLDLLSRYDEEGDYPFENVKEMVAEILKQAIVDDKGIEINTASWQYGLKDTQPAREILRLYKDLGGRIITIGSDAHTAKYVGAHIKDAMDILKNEIGFSQICTFDHMRPVFHEL